jgi:hypothetical protein
VGNGSGWVQDGRDKKREEKKVKKRFSMVLALAMVFVLVMSTAVLAEENEPEDAISNVLELTVDVSDGELTEPTIKVNDDFSSVSAVGLYDCFTVSTTPGGYEDELVRVKLAANPATGFKLEYVEQDSAHDDYKKYLLLPVDEEGVAWFGPSTGFPLRAVDDSMFRVTWETAGTYNFTLSIMGGEDFGTELASDTVTVNVAEGNAMALAHATANAGEYANIKDETAFNNAMLGLIPNLKLESLTKNINKEETFDYVIAADLANNVSHVDNVLFVFEVAKAGGGITEGDFEITAISLRDDTEGINETFVVEEGKLKGFWGPPKGLLFAGQAATAFTVKFNAEGTYTVNTYAIQVKPAETADL